MSLKLLHRALFVSLLALAAACTLEDSDEPGGDPMDSSKLGEGESSPTGTEFGNPGTADADAGGPTMTGTEFGNPPIKASLRVGSESSDTEIADIEQDSPGVVLRRAWLTIGRIALRPCDEEDA